MNGKDTSRTFYRRSCGTARNLKTTSRRTSVKKRTPEDKYEDYRQKGRSIQQMMCVATARGDEEFAKFLAEKEAEDDDIYS